MTHIELSLSGLAALVVSLLGSKAFLAAGQIVGDVTQQPLPEWANMLMGPFGGFVGLVLGLVWMAKRLNKAEAKAEKRDEERDIHLKSMIAVVEQNSVVLRDTKEVLEEVKSKPCPRTP